MQPRRHGHFGVAARAAPTNVEMAERGGAKLPSSQLPGTQDNLGKSQMGLAVRAGTWHDHKERTRQASVPWPTRSLAAAKSASRTRPALTIIPVTCCLFISYILIFLVFSTLPT